MTRILMTVTAMHAGGAERMAAELTDELTRRGHDVGILGAGGPLDAMFAPTHFKRFPSHDYGRSATGVVLTAHEAARAMRDFKPEIVHAQNARATLISWLSISRPFRRRHPRPRLVASFQGLAAAEYNVGSRLLRLADAIGCVSDELRDGLARAGVPPQKLTTIPNGVPLPEPLQVHTRRALEAELGTRRPKIAIVGRLVPQKAHDRFLRAARLVTKTMPGAQFLVVGDGPLRQQLEMHSGQLGLQKHVRFLGLRSDSRQLIAFSDIVVFSSNWEGLSVAALEALAARVPVVSTPAHGMTELLSSGGGIVVDPTEAAIAAAVLELCSAPDRRASLGDAGRALVEAEYSTAHMASRYEALYARMLASRRL